MAVKRSQSVARALSVLEMVASRQPIGVSALAKLLEEDRSAVQRSVMTLADAGWIRVAPEPPVRWELSPHVFTIAHLPQSTSELRQRARRVLEELRSKTGETAFLAIPDINRFVVVDVVESEHMLRMSTRMGEIISPLKTATGRAVLPYLDRERQATMLGRAPNRAELGDFAATRARGFSISVNDVLQGASNLGAPVFDNHGRPMGAIVVSGPTDRLSIERHDGIGKLLARYAQGLSRSAPTADAG